MGDKAILDMVTVTLRPDGEKSYFTFHEDGDEHGEWRGPGDEIMGGDVEDALDILRAHCAAPSPQRRLRVSVLAQSQTWAYWTLTPGEQVLTHEVPGLGKLTIRADEI